MPPSRRVPAVLGQNTAPGKITRLPGATEDDRLKPNRTEPKPTPFTASPSRKPLPAHGSQGSAPCPIATPGSGGSFPRRELGGALRLPPRCPSRLSGAREDVWKCPQCVPLAVGSPQTFSRGKGTSFALRLRLMGVVSFAAVKSGGGGKRTRFLETQFRKFSRQKGAGPLPLTERKRGANSVSRRKWSCTRYHLILDNQKKDS